VALAKWYKIDFHTHTPESKCFSDKSITPAMWLKAAKDSGLNAVVVSDHNSVGFIKKIESIKHDYEEKNKFKVFYGIEACISADFTHILIIFDDEMGVTAVEDAVIGCLGLTRDKWGNTEQYVTEDNLKKLCNNYGNSIFIIPAHFASNKGLGKSNINAIKRYQEFVKFSAVEVRTDEDIKEYENKFRLGAINKAPLVTGSDNPSLQDPTKHSVEGFGTAFTWVKVSDLSFEGLRQAFIDPDYRVINGVDLQELGDYYNPNDISFNYIAGMKFNGISHMTNLNMRFSPHLNCIVGGRGSGKSTIVDALNYGVGNEIDLTKCTLLDKTLQRNGSITTYFNFGNSKSYQINLSRSGKRTSLMVEDDSGPVEEYPDFKIDFYGQKEIFRLIDDDSDIERQDRSPLIKMIDDKVGAELFSYKGNIEDALSKLNSLSNEYINNQKKLQGMPEIKAQIEKFESTLDRFKASGVDEAGYEYEIIKALIHSNGEKLNSEKQILGGFINDIKRLNQYFEQEDAHLLGVLDDRVVNQSLTSQLKDLNIKIIGFLDEKLNTIKCIEESFSDSTLYTELKSRRDKYQAALNAIHDVDRDSINGIQTQLQMNRSIYEDLRKLQLKQVNIEKSIEEAIDIFVDKRIELSDKRREVINGLELEGIKIDLNIFEHISRWKSNLQKEFGKEGVFDSDFTKLSEWVLLPNNNFENYKRFIKFILVDKSGDLNNCCDLGFDQRFNKMWIDKQKNDTLSSLVRIVPEDKVNIKIIESSEEIDINDGSPGQKSAAILAFILNSGDNPLIIDQPEDDLDNSLIYSLIVKSIRRMKSKRQIIIVTHNPNIPVLGDAEGIFILDRDSNGKVTFRKDKKAGCIEEKVIREGICEIMEGGEVAFKKREEKYLSYI
jgi:predicted ATPase